jgi:hypothetical protein
MTLTIKPVTSFTFVSPQGEITYTLNIPAHTEAEAREKLTRDLSAIIEEIKAKAKPGPNQ